MDPVRAEEPDAEGPALQPWQRLLSAVLKARRTAIAARASHGPTVGIGGCLRRLLVILVLLIISIAAAFFVFGRALLNAVQPY